MKEKKLFQLGHPKGKKYLKAAGVQMSFPNKIAAKVVRDEMNSKKSLDGMFFVTTAEDHWRYHV